MSFKSRCAALGALTAVLILMVSGPAFAEGSFASYLQGWLPGVSSRSWSDHNRDGDPTQITLGGCRAVSDISVPVVPRLQLTRETPWYLPDENRGRKDFACWLSGDVMHSWGRQPSGSFQVTLSQVNGSDAAVDKISASRVRVGW